MTTPNRESIVSFLADIFARRGAEEYLGEPVTMAEHMLQGAALAEAEGASDELVAAALLHDIGHFTSEFGAYSPDDTEDKHHDEAGAEVLAPFFPPLVSECVRLHVAAKRYLCATDPSYFAKLSPASVHTLQLQGGPMGPEEVEAFRRHPFHREAVRVRLWDEAGKVAGAKTPAFAHYRPLLERVVARRCGAAREARPVTPPREGAAPPIRVAGIDHVVLRVENLEKMLDFYTRILGCRLERSQEEIGLYQLRAGTSLIDLVTVEGKLGAKGGAAPGPEGRNMDHLCLRLADFDGERIKAHLARHGVAIGEEGVRYGAGGSAPSLYLIDPEGNGLELRA